MINFISHYSGSKGNLYSIDDGKTSLLLEPGVPIQKIKKALNFNLSNQSGCLVSHFHQDHSCATKDIASAGTDIYTSQSVIDHYGLAGHRIHMVKHKQQFQIGSFTVRAMDVPHDKDTPNLAFLFASGKDKLLFLIDALYCPYIIPGLTSIAIGINYDLDILKQNIKEGHLNPALGRRIIQSHMSLATALEFFKTQDMSQVQTIHILHCSKSNLNKDKAKKAIQRLTGKLVII